MDVRKQTRDGKTLAKEDWKEETPASSQEEKEEAKAMKPKWDERRLAVWRNQGIRGMTRGLFFRMWEEQDGKCRICKEVLSTGSSGRSGFTLDHDHSTGRPRSLLCQGCNKHSALKEDADINKFRDTPYYDYVLQHRKVNDVEGLDGSGKDKMDC